MISGDPIVRKETYMNQVLMREVAMPNRSPMAEQTPKACHSINCLNRFMPLN
jgi:hypothetical protein